jgi:hypothetical protein
MKTCPKCQSENADSNRICIKCGSIFRQDPPLKQDPEQLRKQIEGLELALTGKEGELDALKLVLTSRDQQIAGLQLDLKAKEAELEIANKKIVEQPSNVKGATLSIESYPLKNSNFHLSIDQANQDVDLSTTPFQIHAKVECRPDGINLVVNDGALVNVRFSDHQKWQRYPGGSRIKAVAGMILFDPKGAMSARLVSGS